jgi:hypothetical protein
LEQKPFFGDETGETALSRERSLNVPPDALSQRWHEQAGADAALKVAGPPRRTA